MLGNVIVIVQQMAKNEGIHYQYFSSQDDVSSRSADNIAAAWKYTQWVALKASASVNALFTFYA